MKALPFAIGRVNRLRRAAMNAREIPDYDSDWSRGGFCSFAHGQANDLLRVFDTLWLKQGFVLYAYAYREFHGGNGRIWAVPTDSVPWSRAKVYRRRRADKPSVGSHPAHAGHRG